MNYSIQQKFILHNRSHKVLKPIGIALHETASLGATAANEFNFFNDAERKASAHAFVGWDGIIQTIPWNEKSWHACEPANSMFIGIELCHATNKEQFNDIWNKAIWLYAYLFINILHIHTVTKGNLMAHAEISAKWHNTTHTDPVAYFAEYGKTVDQFRAVVQVKINSILNPVQEGGGFELMKYPLKPIAKGLLINTTSLECCSKPSNSARTGHYLKVENGPFNIFARCTNEGIDWYLVNAITEQWVAAHYVQIVK